MPNAHGPELKKTSLDAYETGGELTLTQEETAETIVPDYLPDIARIIETEGRVAIQLDCRPPGCVDCCRPASGGGYPSDEAPDPLENGVRGL